MGSSRRIGMPVSAKILDFDQWFGRSSAMQVIRTDRRFAVAAWDVEHIGRLAEAGVAAVQGAHERLSLPDRGPQVRGSRREIAMMQIVRFDAALDQGTHQGRK